MKNFTYKIMSKKLESFYRYNISKHPYFWRFEEDENGNIDRMIYSTSASNFIGCNTEQKGFRRFDNESVITFYQEASKRLGKEYLRNN